MLATRVDTVYEVTLPANVQQFLGYLSFGISFGLGSTTQVLTCLGVGSFHSQLVLWMLLPPVLIGAIIVGCVVRLVYKRTLSCIALVEHALPIVVRLLFLLYPLISNVAFKAFSCYPAFDDGTRYLIVDVWVRCSSPDEYMSIHTTAWWAVSVFAFGLLALNAVLLFLAREAILKQKPTTLSNAIKFLFREYGVHRQCTFFARPSLSHTLL